VRSVDHVGDLPGIGKLVLKVDWRGILKKFAKSGAGICESPNWCFNLEVIQRRAEE